MKLNTQDKRREIGPLTGSQGEFASTSGGSRHHQRGLNLKAVEEVCLKGLTYFLCVRVHIHNVHPCLHEEMDLRT